MLAATVAARWLQDRVSVNGQQAACDQLPQKCTNLRGVHGRCDQFHQGFDRLWGAVEQGFQQWRNDLGEDEPLAGGQQDDPARGAVTPQHGPWCEQAHLGLVALREWIGHGRPREPHVWVSGSLGIAVGEEPVDDVRGECRLDRGAQPRGDLGAFLM